MLSSFEDLQIFTQVLRAGSMTRAARELGVPKSTVSRRLAQLEDRLGVRLLHRTTRRLRPTEAGDALVARCEPLLRELAEAERELREGERRPRGLLRVTGPIESGQAIFGVVLPRLMAAYPDVDVELDLSDRVVDLVAEGFDLAIRAGALTDSTLVARRIARVHRVLCASEGYLTRHRALSRPEELAEHSCLVFPRLPGEVRWRLKDDAREVNVPVRPRLASNSLDVVRAAALAGQGIALLPLYRVADDLAAGRLTRVLEGFRTDDATLSVVMPAGRLVPPKVRAFLEVLTQELERAPWLLEERS